eukprot:93134-Prorocentrum_lima.AAC.1
MHSEVPGCLSRCRIIIRTSKPRTKLLGYSDAQGVQAIPLQLVALGRLDVQQVCHQEGPAMGHRRGSRDEA